MVKNIKQYDVYWISLDPVQGSEMNKTRPCIVISPDELNGFLRTIVIAPITSKIRNYPWRMECYVSRKKGSIAVDQIKTVDKTRISSKISSLSQAEIENLKRILHEMFVD